MENIDYTRFIAGFVFIVALIGTIGWLLKRFQQSGRLMPKSPIGKRVKIQGRVTVDPKRQLMVVQWDDEEFLLMLGQHGETVVGNKKALKFDHISPITTQKESA